MAELREAAKAGDAARVESALAAGANINFQDKFVRMCISEDGAFPQTS